MNRYIYILIISILFSQSAWAFHDVELNNSHDQIYLQAAEHSDDISENFDHCGHANAHLVGLISSNTVEISVSAVKQLNMFNNTLSSISYQPPVPPPNV